jgi:ABC-type transporter Mla subunit MlaD
MSNPKDPIESNIDPENDFPLIDALAILPQEVREKLAEAAAGMAEFCQNLGMIGTGISKILEQGASVLGQGTSAANDLARQLEQLAEAAGGKNVTSNQITQDLNNSKPEETQPVHRVVPFARKGGSSPRPQ